MESEPMSHRHCGHQASCSGHWAGGFVPTSAVARDQAPFLGLNSDTSFPLHFSFNPPHGKLRAFRNVVNSSSTSRCPRPSRRYEQPCLACCLGRRLLCSTPPALPRAPVAAEGRALGQLRQRLAPSLRGVLDHARPDPWLGTTELIPGWEQRGFGGNCNACPSSACRCFWVSTPEHTPGPGRGPGEPTLGPSQLTTDSGLKWEKFLKKQGFTGKP